MTDKLSVRDFCHYALEANQGRPINDPVLLGSLFREYAGLNCTPNIKRTVELIKSMGIDIKAVDYLDSGGINMTANGTWHVHYAVKDKPGTQKFDIFHELFEVVHKTFITDYPIFSALREPQLSQYADRFAASALIPPAFFSKRVTATGCDVIKLGEELELSHQCILIALGRCFADVPFVGAIYERQPGKSSEKSLIADFLATVVVKTGRARRIKDLCWLQVVPVRKSHPQPCSLVCASLASGRSVLWRSPDKEDAPVVLVRTLLSTLKQPYRVILMALPNDEFSTILPQVDQVDPIVVNGESSCPYLKECPNANSCLWKTTGGYYE
jgi:hypothetical protein